VELAHRVEVVVPVLVVGEGCDVPGDLALQRDAVSWRVGTEEFENGYFYTPSDLWAKKVDGTEELVDSWEIPSPDGDDARQQLEDALGEMGDRDGPLGERASHESDIRQAGATR
jgi:hypothetical protein